LPKVLVVVLARRRNDTWVIDAFDGRRADKGSRLMALGASTVCIRRVISARRRHSAHHPRHELVVDFPGDVMLQWELAAISGSIVRSVRR
jgi:hypothetical protein